MLCGLRTGCTPVGGRQLCVDLSSHCLETHRVEHEGNMHARFPRDRQGFGRRRRLLRMCEGKLMSKLFGRGLRELSYRSLAEAPEWQEGQPHFCDPMFDDKSVPCTCTLTFFFCRGFWHPSISLRFLAFPFPPCEVPLVRAFHDPVRNRWERLSEARPSSDKSGGFFEAPEAKRSFPCQGQEPPTPRQLYAYYQKAETELRASASCRPPFPSQKMPELMEEVDVRILPKAMQNAARESQRPSSVLPPRPFR